MASGGGDLSHLKPLDPAGNLFEDRLGCHRGDYEHMNVRHPQPGMVYYYEKDKRARINARMRKGYKVVGPDDPERKGLSNDPNYQGTDAEGIQSFDDVVLMKCPEETVRARSAEKIKRNEDEINGATEKFLRAGSGDERRYSSPGKPIRFKSPKHRVYTIDSRDQEQE